MTADELRHGRVAAAVRRDRIIAVLRRIEPRERLLALVDELADAGVRLFEVTWDAPEAADDVTAVREALERRYRDAAERPLVGAGTLLSREALGRARSAGADFGVSPVLDVALVRESIAAGFPFVPGAATPTEIAAAWSAGATFVKLFPASALGPSFVRELRGPLAAIELIPTGGIDAGNARAFLDAGAAAIGIGSALARATPDERRDLVAALVRSA